VLEIEESSGKMRNGEPACTIEVDYAEGSHKLALALGLLEHFTPKKSPTFRQLAFLCANDRGHFVAYEADFGCDPAAFLVTPLVTPMFKNGAFSGGICRTEIILS
jgi:hypothetical protein